MEPDFILMDSDNGVAIFEVKDWSISYIKLINRKNVETTDKKKLENPVRKTNGYYDLVKGALEYLLKDDKLKDEVEKFYEGETGIESNRKDNDSNIEFLNGDYSVVVNKIDELTKVVNKYSDILVLCKDNKKKSA